MKNLILALAAWISVGTALAGEVVGNGGDVLVCPNKKPELLDFYEARVLKKITRRPDLSGATAIEIAKSTLRDLEKINPARARIYHARIESFYNDASFVSDARLEDIPDSAHVVLPIGCALKQIAIQVPRGLPRDPIYIVDKSLWDAMDLENQAGLILHEVIYTDAIRYGHTNSISVRYLNGVLPSDRLAGMSIQEYDEWLRTLRLPKLVELNSKGMLFVGFLDSTNVMNGNASSNATCRYYGMERALEQEVRPLAKKFAEVLMDRYQSPSKVNGWVVTLTSSDESAYGTFHISKNAGLQEQNSLPQWWLDNVICRPAIQIGSAGAGKASPGKNIGLSLGRWCSDSCENRYLACLSSANTDAKTKACAKRYAACLAGCP